jgi:hypothetical protein
MFLEPEPNHEPLDQDACDRRSAPRVPYETAVVLAVQRPDGEFGAPFAVEAVDISPGGAAVLSRQMVHPGTIGALHLLMPQTEPLVVGIEVMRCEYIGDMQHRVGLRFTHLHPKYAQSKNMTEACKVLKCAAAQHALRKSMESKAA